jgi:hypothetical protein
VADRFPLYTDADVHGPLILALRRRGWDLIHAIDLYPPGTPDAVHFERAARDNRVLISNDHDMEVTWLSLNPSRTWSSNSGRQGRIDLRAAAVTRPDAASARAGRREAAGRVQAK